MPYTPRFRRWRPGWRASRDRAGVTNPGPALDTLRARVASRGLTGDAVGQLTPVVSGLSLEALGPVKQLLKRFFSDAPWTDADDEALADAIGAPGDGSGAAGRHELEPGLTLVWTWEAGRFRLRLESDELDDERGESPVASASNGAETDLEELFDGVVVPEATPSPRTIRFATPPLGTGASRAYDSADADDPRVARLFAAFDEVTNVLVGPDFVAITITRPDRWAALLGPVLRAVSEEFATDDGTTPPASQAPVTMTLSVGSTEGDARAPRKLERAWAELGALRLDEPGGLDRVLAASRDSEPARRQVAAALLAEARPEAAMRAWGRLLDDESRAVRRSVVDAITDASREELRPLLERALTDSDAWVRWKALRGISALGVGPSRAAVESAATDPDFRVRLEATRALTRGPGY